MYLQVFANRCLYFYVFAGLANLYGDNELSDNMDRASELKTIENKLMKHLMTFTWVKYVILV